MVLARSKKRFLKSVPILYFYMTFFSRHKRIIFPLLLAITISGGIFIFDAPKAHAGFFGWVAGQAVKIGFTAVISIVQGFSTLLLWILSWFVWLASQLLDAVFAIEKFNDIPAVKAGWEICRGLCNMFFALALLVMAFATILRIDKYGMKEYLWKIVVAALLINFSLVIAGVFIDASQVFTNYFKEAAGGTKHSISAQLMKGLNAANTLDVYDASTKGETVRDADGNVKITADTGEVGKQLATGAQGAVSVLISAIFGSIVMLITAFTLFAACVFLIVRIVVIWLLLIFSPFAWLSFALPGKAGSLWDKWWQNFLKWVFFAPIYAFFIYLVTLMIGSGSTNVIASIFANSRDGVLEGKGFTGILSGMLQGGVQMLLQYIIIIVILLGGLFIAQSFGIYGAKGIIKMGRGMVGGLGSIAQRWMAKGAESQAKKDTRTSRAWASFRRGTSYLAPEVWKEAWKKRQEQLTRESMPVAVGARQDRLNRIISLRTFDPRTWGKGGGGETTDFRERAVRARRQEERKNINTINAEEQFHGFEEAKKRGNTSKMAAYLQAATEQNDQNEFLRNLNKSTANTKNPTNYTMDAAGWTDFLEKEVKPELGEEQTYRLGHDLTRIMEGNGQVIGRMFTVNAETGQYHMVGLSEGSKETIGNRIKKLSQGSEEDKAKAQELNMLVKEHFKDLNGLNDKKALEKFNKRSWSQRTDIEKELIADVARTNATVEWSKQDPQMKARTIGRFGLIKEGYGPDGRTIDLGLHGDWSEKISQIPPKQSDRWQGHTRKLMLLNHAGELEKANKALYDACVTDYRNKTAGMSDEQIKQTLESEATDVASIEPAKREESLNKLIKSIKGGGATEKTAAKPVGNLEMENPELNK